MLVGGVIDDQLDEYLQLAVMSRFQEFLEVVEGAVTRMDIDVVRDVVAVVTQR